MRTKLICLLALPAALWAQGITSTVMVPVVDPSGAAVAGAQCELYNQATAAVLKTVAQADGACTFTSVPAGTYTLRIAAKGFKSYVLERLVIASSEVRAVAAVVLQLGEVQESIQVTAEAAVVQTESAERSGLVTGSQLQNIALRGRDFFALLATLPGVVDDGSIRREATSPNSVQGTFINGMRDNQKNFTADGISSLDTGSNYTVHFQPNMDAIAEVRVLTSNYQAEYGRNAGGVVSVITKSGSREWHGSAYYFYRHESLNANNFFNNRTATPKSPYRYRINGYTLGGPVYIPNKFNTGKDRLFFFWSQEFTGTRRNYPVRFANMPTEAERNGDYSRSFDAGGRLLTVTDPLTRAPFPGNLIPRARFNPIGQGILNFFPTPNYTDPDPRLIYSRNYRAQYSGDYPRRQEMIRVDYNISDSMRAFYRYMRDADKQIAPWGLWMNSALNFLISPMEFGQPGHGHVAQLVKTFSPTLVNETIFGKSYNKVYFDLTDPSAVDRSRAGNPPQWYNDPPGVGIANYAPNLAFGSPPVNPAVFSLFHPPYMNYNDIWSLVNNTSWIRGTHTIKAGFYLERTKKFAPNWANYRGAFSFAPDVNNPGNTGRGYANALLGNYTSYTETSQRLELNLWFTNLEWFVQDGWRATRRLTLDYGIRFYWMPHTYDQKNQIAVFDPAFYDRARAPALYRPALLDGRQVAQDPRTGATAPAVFIGRLVPGSGDPANGMRVAGKDGLPRGIMDAPGIKFGPRFGFAYDLTGNGSTALRGGFGVFYDRPQGQPSVDASGQPPIAYSPVQFYGSLANFTHAGLLGASSLNNLSGRGEIPGTMNYSLGVQRRLGSTTLDVAYVGSLSRHLLVNRNINPIPIGARFDPANANPANPAVALADTFLRRYLGFEGIVQREFSATANYNSLQISANRRFTRGLQFGAAYTFSKTLGVSSTDYGEISPYFSPRQRNYGPLSFDRPHVLVINYIYDLPGIARRLGLPALKWITDGWQVSGITSFIMGAPVTPGFTTVDAADISGSSEAARIDVVGNPRLSSSEKRFDRVFRTEAFARPVRGSFGNAGVGILRGPGTNNWDVSVTKRIPLGAESRFLQFRTEMFNAWNHTQFSAFGATAIFDRAGIQTNPSFGMYTAARDPRVIQLSFRLAF